MTVLVEAAVESVAAALAAAEGGASRIELCADLAHGGTTSDVALLRDVVSRLPLPVFVLVRPRPGDFVYTRAEHRAMLEQVAQSKAAGAAGIVTGALRTGREIDELRTAELIAAARPLPVTFHRAFDACRDPEGGLAALIRLGVERVLTSGGAPAAHEGASQIRTLVELARGRIEILAGGGILPENVARLVQDTGVREIHCSVQNVQKVRAIVKALG